MRFAFSLSSRLALLAVCLSFASPLAHAATVPDTTAPAAAAAPAAAPLPAPVTADGKSNFSDAQRSELLGIMRQYILDNPQALIASVESFYNKQNTEKTKQEGRVETAPTGLYDTPQTPFVGPKDAKFSVVYFFDYNCGFCKQVDLDLRRVISEEPNIKFLFKELPILNESSELASRWAVAANRQGKYLDYHSALMKFTGKIDEESLMKMAKEVGMDPAKLKIDASSPDITDGLNRNVDIARELGIRGTPFFVIGKEKVPGAIGYTKMKELIGKERDGIVVPQAARDAAAAANAEAPVDPSTMPVDPETQLILDRARQETKEMLNDVAKDLGAVMPVESGQASTPAATPATAPAAVPAATPATAPTAPVVAPTPAAPAKP